MSSVNKENKYYYVRQGNQGIHITWLEHTQNGFYNWKRKSLVERSEI